jgi:hypothetical protein
MRRYLTLSGELHEPSLQRSARDGPLLPHALAYLTQPGLAILFRIGY